MSQRVQFQMLKSLEGLRAGQAAHADVGEALGGGGLGTLRTLEGLSDTRRFCMRTLPGHVGAWGEHGRKIASLGNPNVVPVVGVGALEERPFFVEERPEGDALDRWIRARFVGGAATPLHDVGRVAVGVATALRHAHDAGVPHGGLSSGCVTVHREQLGELDVRVSGFGLVAGFHAQRAGLPPEVWETFAPELAADLGQTTPGADLFAFGVLLLELLTGRIHPGATRHPWREVAKVYPPDDLRRLLGEQREDVPDALWSLVATLLDPNPRTRAPASSGRLASMLKKLSWTPKEPPEQPARAATPRAVPDSRVPVPASVAKVVSAYSQRVTPEAAPHAPVDAEPDTAEQAWVATPDVSPHPGSALADATLPKRWPPPDTLVDDPPPAEKAPVAVRAVVASEAVTLVDEHAGRHAQEEVTAVVGAPASRRRGRKVVDERTETIRETDAAHEEAAGAETLPLEHAQKRHADTMLTAPDAIDRHDRTAILRNSDQLAAPRFVSDEERSGPARSERAEEIVVDGRLWPVAATMPMEAPGRAPPIGVPGACERVDATLPVEVRLSVGPAPRGWSQEREEDEAPPPEPPWWSTWKLAVVVVMVGTALGLLIGGLLMGGGR